MNSLLVLNLIVQMSANGSLADAPPAFAKPGYLAQVWSLEPSQAPQPLALEGGARRDIMRFMSGHRIYSMAFAKVYAALLAKSERKGRAKAELDQIIHWLTGYDKAGLAQVLKDQRDMTGFFEQAPAMNPQRSLVTGVVCGVRVEDVEEPLMREIRVLDKMVDELAKGKAMDKILRQA